MVLFIINLSEGLDWNDAGGIGGGIYSYSDNARIKISRCQITTTILTG